VCIEALAHKAHICLVVGVALSVIAGCVTFAYPQRRQLLWQPVAFVLGLAPPDPASAPALAAAALEPT
jgi:hypothetical protein